MDKERSDDKELDRRPAEGSLEAGPPTHGLSDKKLRSVEMLVAGVAPGVVAKRIGISRETLWRWRNEHAFREHLQRLRLEFHAARVDRLWNLTDRSLDVVEQHLEEGNLQAANILLRLAQLNPSDPVSSGPTEGEVPVLGSDED
ncbi:MAG: Helix-turn-helix of insertion element transposase [Actinomycetota bacterium]|jgi:hypothetical protein|nr:Helix-turn-helix of insertion element transposase [Actinomycetota bacterium]